MLRKIIPMTEAPKASTQKAAQQMTLCPWTNKKYGLKWYWHFHIAFSETQKQIYETFSALIFTWIVLFLNKTEKNAVKLKHIGP